MSSDIEHIKLQMVEQYELGGQMDVAEWARRHPEHRDEILDFWTWLRGTPRLAEIEAAPPPQIGDNVGEDAFRQATMAVALGRQWLEEPVDDAEEIRLGIELERCRRQPYQHAGTAPIAFRRAAVYAWVVCAWQRQRPRVSRLATQKATYLLERALSLGLFREHQPKRLGPYDHTARYRDAEPIASKQQWLRINGSVLEPGRSAAKVHTYAPRYLRQEALARRLLDALAALSEQELEAWATVDAATCSLLEQGLTVTVRSIREELAATPEWKSKLARQNFSDTEIERTLTHLVRLRLVQL